MPQGANLSRPEPARLSLAAGVFISRVVASGASIKEAQALARHSTPLLTMNTYRRAALLDVAGAVAGLGRLTLGVRAGCEFGVGERWRGDSERSGKTMATTVLLSRVSRAAHRLPASSLTFTLVGRILRPAAYVSASLRRMLQTSRSSATNGDMSTYGNDTCVMLTKCRRRLPSATCHLAYTACALAWLASVADTATAMTIYVLDSTYSSLTLDVEPSDTIENVKAKIQDQSSIAHTSQYLYSGSSLLEDGYTLSDYSIGRGSTLPMVATTAFTSTPLPNVVWNFGVNDMTAGAGIGWTLWQAASAVDFSSYGSGAITFNVFAYDGSLAGTPVGYDPMSSYSLTFLTAAGGIGGFSASQFSVTGSFADTASITQSGNSLLLQIAGSSVPEIDPAGTGSVLAFLTGAFGLLERRRLKLKLA